VRGATVSLGRDSGSQIRGVEVGGCDDCVLAATLEKSLGTAKNSLCLGRESVMVSVVRAPHTGSIVQLAEACGEVQEHAHQRPRRHGVHI
jgi:hypothetical protein